MKSPRSILCALCLLGLLGASSLAQAVRTELMVYDITWIGISVGSMTVESATNEAGNLLRTIRIQNRPWISALYSVDNTLQCVSDKTPEGNRHTITKKMAEMNLRQNDTLVLLPDAGRAVWSNSMSNTVHAFTVPKGSRDFVCFFFDLRDAAGGGPLIANGEYQLVMDKEIQSLQIKTGSAENIRTPNGHMEAIPVQAISESPTLFSRNKPRAVWVATTKAVVIFADVETRFGNVRGTLVKWEVDGQPVQLDPAFPLD